MTALVLLVVGCSGNTSTEQNSPSGSASLEPLVYTLYSDKTELFVEFKPLVIGERSNFAAHFTILGEQFLPLTMGSVTVSLIVGDNGIRNTADSISSPGIFRLALIPNTAGVGRLVFDIKTGDYTDQIIIDNILIHPSAQAALDQQVVSDSSDEITYLKEQAWKVEFANAPIVRVAFADILKTSGQLLSAPGDEVVISASTGGIVRFMGNNATVGSPVSRNTAMFAISGGNLTENNTDGRYRIAKANFDKAEADFERAKKLVVEKIISQADFLNYQNDFEIAKVSFDAIDRNNSASGQTVTSPLNGYVKNLIVINGQYVNAGEILAVVSQNRKIVLQANVSQRYFDKLPRVTSAHFKPLGSDQVFDTAKMNGRVVAFGKSASAQSAFLPITIEFDNVGNLVPGSAVEVFLKSAPLPNALVIPVSALMEEQGVNFVYVQTGGELFQRRDIKIGASDGLMVQVLSGVVEGERVVTKGAYYIKLATASGEIPAHGHEH